MANRKISDLTTLTAPATGDLLPIVDISEAAAADKNKKITYGELLASAPAGSAAAPSFSFDGDPNTGIFNPAADTLAFAEGGSEAMRIDSSARLLVGTSTSTNNIRLQQKFAVVGSGTGALDYPGMSITAYNTNGYIAPFIDFQKSNGATDGTMTVVASGDSLGYIIFRGADGTNFVDSVIIKGEIDGTPGANDMPGRLVFYTTADGASSPTERMRIKSNGTINFSNVATYADNAAATSGGLVAGDIYRKSDGTLMIRY